MPVEYAINPLAPLTIGANLYAGAMAQEAQEQANAVEARRYKQQAHYQRKMDRKNIELQKQFAQQSIRWKVADAEAAGIHPLYALGSPASSFSPVSVGGPATSGPTAETGMANALAASGQDISRAIHATRTQSERDQAFLDTYRALQLKNMGLQSELFATQIAKLNASQIGPPGPDLTIPEASNTPRQPLVSDFGLGQLRWLTNPKGTSGTDWNQRYSDEFPGNIPGVISSLMSDLWYNSVLGRYTNRQWPFD